MTRSTRTRCVVPAALFLVAACGHEPPARGDSTGSVAPPSSAAAPARTADTGAAVAATPTPEPKGPACISEGDWQPCSVEKRLTDAGFVPIEQGASPSGVFPVPGTTYALGPAHLHVYLFPSAKAREEAVAGIDTVAVAKPGSPGSWAGPATLITSNNLAAVLVSDNGRLVERVQNAITAGLPSAAR